MKNLTWLILLSGVIAFGQQDVPQDYFSDPLDITMILSGSFGELRSNHFHSGLDIKTQQKVGAPIYAPADGYVSRIKVAHGGYGKALYIKHPNGYSTVYAHLQKYNGKIEAYVKEQQYSRESYEIELFPEPVDLTVNKGDLIAYTGNSGSSGGPHLHFEIRDGASRPMNPLLFGIEIPDTKKPLINSVFAYPMSEDAQVNGSQDPVKLRLILQKDGSYKAENVTAFGTLGFGVSSYDQQNGASNKNGVYKIETSYNGESTFEVLFEKFSFDETRYLNRYIDYEYFRKNKSRVQKLFRESNNPLSLIKTQDGDGTVSIDEGFSAVYTIRVSDFAGNVIPIVIPIEGKRVANPRAKKDRTTEDYVYHDQATSITKGKFSIYIPAGSLYEDAYLDIDVQGDTLKFHKDEIPIHRNITLTVDASNYSTADRNKLFIARLSSRGEPYHYTTRRNGDKLTARTRTLGTYTLASDVDAPVITPVNFSDEQWISNNETLKVKIEDELSGIGSYRATVNGKFILMEYDYKKDVLTYDFDDDVVTETENKLKVIVTDNVGNSTTFEATFFRKQL